MTNRWATGTVASGQIPLVLFPDPVPGEATQARVIPDMQMAGYWGFVLRVSGYSGPCCQVEDAANPGVTQDVGFNAKGFVTASLPFGSNTRLVRVYDQLGNGDDLVAPASAGIEILFENDLYGTWRAKFTGGGGLQSVKTVAENPTWAVTEQPYWFCSLIRTRFFVNFSALWSIPRGSGLMSMGVVQFGHVLAWRINGSSNGSWEDSDIEVFLEDHFFKLARLQGDMSGQSPAIGYHNGTVRSSRTFNHPITYDSTSRVQIGTGIGSDSNTEQWLELGIYETDFQATGTTTSIRRYRGPAGRHCGSGPTSVCNNPTIGGTSICRF